MSEQPTTPWVEVRRLLRTRWWWVLLIVTALLSAVTVLAHLVIVQGFSGEAMPARGRGGSILVGGNGPARVLAMVAGVVIAGAAERRAARGGGRPDGPDENLIMTKLCTAVASGVGHALTALVVGVLGVVAAAVTLNVQVSLSGRAALVVALHLLAVVLWALIGLGVGLLIRPPAIAVAVVLFACYLVPLLLDRLRVIDTVVWLLPWVATSELLTAGLRGTSAGLGSALAVVGGWAIILLVAGFGVMLWRRTPRPGNQEMSR